MTRTFRTSQPQVPYADWLADKRRSLLDLAREAGMSARERADSYMAMNKALKLVGML